MRAIIAGGGIAGTTCALALQQAGIEVTVIEAYPPSDGSVGSYLTVTANGLAAFESVGLHAAIEAAGFPTRMNVMWNQDGRRLAALSLDSTLPGSPHAITIKRSALVRIIQTEAVRRGLPVMYGRRLVAMMSMGDGVQVSLDDGTDLGGDLLIGADGVHSLVRRAIDPTAPQGRYVGLSNFGGITRDADVGTEPGAWHLIFGRHAFFGYQVTPGGDVVWFANVPGPMITTVERDGNDETAWRRRLVELFDGDAGPAVSLIEAGEFELMADNTHDLPNVPVWHRGSMVIIGDAAHAPAPTAGQGASMAAEDAVALAGSLALVAPLEDALVRYEMLRRKRVERIVAWGARGSSDKVPGRIGRIFRDALLRAVFRYVVTPKSLAWMYDYRVTPVTTNAATTQVAPARTR